MKIKVKYIDNEIQFEDDKINAIEIENKKYFYRFVMDLYNISNACVIEDISFFSENLKELNYEGKIKLYFNYFDFDFNAKKYINDISKLITTTISDIQRDAIIKQYNKLVNLYNKLLMNIDLPLCVNNDTTMENINKTMKIQINNTNDLLENILLLIDLEKAIPNYNILIFINLKQYLNKDELIELYKYAIYNQIKIILIDSMAYGVTLEYEKKLIIDSNLDEFVI